MRYWAWETHNLEKRAKKEYSIWFREQGQLSLSHSFGLMTDICDRVGVVHQGELRMVGTPEEAISKYYELTGGMMDW